MSDLNEGRAGSARAEPRPLILQYDEPANEWGYRMEALPLGNGSVGAMFTGGAIRDVILLNHDRLRRAKYREGSGDVGERLPRLRKLCLAGEWEDAQAFLKQMVEDAGGSRDLNAYHPVCDLIVEMDLPGPAGQYRRTLFLEKAVGEVRFGADDVRFTRTSFVSAPDDLLVMRVEASRPGGIDCEVAVGRLPTEGCALEAAATDEGIRLVGRYEEGVGFEVRIRVEASGGEASAVTTAHGAASATTLYHRSDRTEYTGPGMAGPSGDVGAKLVSVRVSNADQLTVLVSVRVFDVPEEAEAAGQESWPDAPRYDDLLSRHISEQGEQMGRVSLRLGEPGDHADAEPTADRLLHEAYVGRPSSRLFELVFQMGRYLLLASSRPGSLPANLQGIWSHSYSPPWQCRYQLDLNVQMCQWLANLTNLDECNLPLFDFLDGLTEAGERYARDLFGCRGIVLPYGTDGTNVRYPSSGQCVAGWLAQHYWEHYQFTQDAEFLSGRAYPFMTKVGAFFEDFLFKGDDGEYVVLPSSSPENIPAGRKVGLSGSATIDLAVVRELFGNLLRASEILGVDKAMRIRWKEIFEHLPDWPIGSDGALREWVYPSDEDNDDHRHFSHLYPLHPGAAFTTEDTPELVQAAVKAIKKREAAFRADACGWSYAWLGCLYARAGDGEEAYRNLSLFLGGFVMDNLLSSMGDWRQQGLGRRRHGYRASHIFQIEAGLGATAAMAEMLLQSHAGLIRILPALPSVWPSGEVHGLRARGGFEVDVEWRTLQVQQVRIKSIAGGPCRVKLCRPAAGRLHVCDRKGTVALRQDSRGILQLDTAPGETYSLIAASESAPRS